MTLCASFVFHTIKLFAAVVVIDADGADCDEYDADVVAGVPANCAPVHRYTHMLCPELDAGAGNVRVKLDATPAAMVAAKIVE